MGKASNRKIQKKVDQKIAKRNDPKNVTLQYTQTIRAGNILPPIEEIEKFEKLLKGAANRLLIMAENNNNANIVVSKKENQRVFWYHQTGQIFEFIIALSIIAIGGLVILYIKSIYIGGIIMAFGFSPIFANYFKRNKK